MTIKEFFKEMGIPEKTETKEVKMMDPETTDRIISRICKNPDGTVYEEAKLKDWQWEIMLKNETEGEDFT
jgi:Mn-dependent DtxR family transcriptional regulator